MRGCFVTGTDTGAGKTVLAAAIAAALHAAGERVAAFKPVVTGLDEPDEVWPADHELLAAVTGAQAQEVCATTFGPALSPHLAARLAGVGLSLAAMVAAARAAARHADALVVEGVGGLLVPFNASHCVRDLAAELGLPMLVAARPGLGTINHSLLTIEAARAAGLDVRAVVLTPWPDEPTVMQRSNRDTIAALGDVEVATLGELARPGRELAPPALAPTAGELARAGRELAPQRWLDDG